MVIKRRSMMSASPTQDANALLNGMDEAKGKSSSSLPLFDSSRDSPPGSPPEIPLHYHFKDELGGSNGSRGSNHAEDSPGAAAAAAAGGRWSFCPRTNSRSSDDGAESNQHQQHQQHSTGPANPQSPADQEFSPYKNNNSSSNNNNGSINSNGTSSSNHNAAAASGLLFSLSWNDALEAIRRKMIHVPLFLVGMVIVGLGAVVTSRTTVQHAAQQVAVLTNHRKEMDDQLEKASRDVHLLRREISAMDAMIQQQQDAAYYAAASAPTSLGGGGGGPRGAGNQQRALNEMYALQKRLKSEAKLAETLKHQVQTMSKQEVMDKFGPGVHHVAVTLVFPDSMQQQHHHNHLQGASGSNNHGNGNGGPDTFVIELAPMELMPHSVHTFLEMVSLGLLDGCSFILNALHVLKAAPLPYAGGSAAAMAKSFSTAGLESVAFKEYSPSFPHKQYTVGFAADGSPSFYINTEDNSEIHVGDPCFGKIVEGFDAVRRLEASPTRNGIWFEQRIGIKKAVILKQQQQQQQQTQQ